MTAGRAGRPHDYPKIYELLERFVIRSAGYERRSIGPAALGLMNLSDEEKREVLENFAADYVDRCARSFYNDDGLRIFIPVGNGKKENVDYLLTFPEGAMQVIAHGEKCKKAGGTEVRTGKQLVKAGKAALSRLQQG